MTFPDKLGREVSVGDFIAYGHALGRCAALRIGRVLGIKERKLSYWNEEKGFSITVQGIADDWSATPPSLCGRKGTLLYANRTLKLDELPENYRSLFV